MKKTLLYGLLIIVLVTVSLFAACKSETSTATQPTTTKTTQVTTSTTQTTTQTTRANWWDKFGTPQYGGAIVYQIPTNGDTRFDPGQWGGQGRAFRESLFDRDWTVDRAEQSFRTEFVQTKYYSGGLAESWEQKDPTTYVVHLHQGVKWQNIAPVNGREFNSEDVVYTFDRIYGSGHGFTQPTMPFAMVLGNIKNVEALDKYTVQFNMKSPAFYGVYNVFEGGFFSVDILAPEVPVDQLEDWTKAVGTGPWLMDEFVAGTANSYKKNPDYWGYDQRYPKNKLPYADTYKELVIPDTATALAALRSGKIDALQQMNAVTWQQAAQLAKTNPDIIQGTWPSPGQHIQMRVDTAPFTDIKVRQALQLAVDLAAIAKGHYGDTVPGEGCGCVYPGFKGYTLPYSEWPADLQAEYSFNPAKAKQLLAEAGYPSGFKTNCCAAATGEDVELLEIVKAQFLDIGVDLEIRMFADLPAKQDFCGAMKHDQMAYANSIGVAAPPNMTLDRLNPGSQGNYTANVDADYSALIVKARNATSEEEAMKYSTEVDMYALKQHWAVNLLPTVSPIMWQPWLKGNSGEMVIGGLLRYYVTRWWIDASLKK